MKYTYTPKDFRKPTPLDYWAWVWSAIISIVLAWHW